MSSYHRTLQSLVKEFMAERGDGASFTKDELARWALENGKVQRNSSYVDRLVEQKLASEFAEAMRESYSTDPKGRIVRDMYAARIAGKMRWNHRRHASRGFVQTSFVQRRNAIAQDCWRLKSDVDSFSECRCPESPIQMTFDFTNDLAERSAAAEDVA